ncbi:hypothetical protein RGQ13_06455 [Thalassotalea psychrophila]|uniref:Uncharacterized protein n=1 Tax=Thalassotalea psychrophila TaxID=3065647 RepID=A0ABY9TXN6_9GAMM|nr:hypothetical protein RGQ13_06455 [Colwelliaceae bacterium SQ149]
MFNKLFTRVSLVLTIMISMTFAVQANTTEEKQDNLQYYLMIGKPNTQGWTPIIQNEIDMGPAGKAGIEAMGGKFIGFYLGVTESKNYAIVAFPKHTDVARIVFTRTMQGVMEDIQFVPIMTTKQAQDVFKQINAVKIGGNA